MQDSQRFVYERVCAYAECQQPFTTRNCLKRYCSDRCWFLSRPRKAPKYPPWTQDEIKVLRELARKVPTHVIADRLGTRTCQAVQAKAKYLNISLKRYGENWPSAKYSDAIVEQARDLYDEGVRPTVIAKQFGIPLRTIQKYVYYERRLGPPIEYYF